MRRIGVLGSTRGTNLIALMDAKTPIELVISNKFNAGILERAQNYHIPAQFVDPLNLARDAYDATISAILHKHQIDLVVLIGYMRILSDSFVQEWRHKIINVHPSLLPAFAGGMDEQVHKAVLLSGIKETGCTVHYVTEEVDGGPILVQKKCPVYSDDTIDKIKSRVQQLEGLALIEAIQLLS